MRAFNDDTVTLLASGRVVKRDLILFNFDSTFYGFWSGQGVLSYGGIDYVGSGQLIQMQALGSATGMAAVAITATLSAIPNTGLTPDILATIESSNWHQSPVVISRAYIDPDTRTVISVERMFRGYFDKLDHNQQTGNPYTLTAYFESKARDHLKIGYRMAGDSDQRRISATDGFFKYVAVAGQQNISWGRIDSTVSAAGAGNSAFAP